MYPLFETIAVAHFKPLQLQYHQRRMDESFFKLFRQKNPFQLLMEFLSLKIPSSALFKWKIEYNASGFNSFVEPYFPRVINRVELVEINPDFDYSMKFSNRDYFESLKSLHPDCDELILLKNGALTDSTYSNLVLESKLDGKLYTPTAPLLKGTQRQFLLDNEVIAPIPIKVQQLCEFQKIYFINAMLPLTNAPCWDIDSLQR